MLGIQRLSYHVVPAPAPLPLPFNLDRTEVLPRAELGSEVGRDSAGRVNKQVNHAHFATVHVQPESGLAAEGNT